MPLQTVFASPCSGRRMTSDLVEVENATLDGSPKIGGALCCLHSKQSRERLDVFRRTVTVRHGDLGIILNWAGLGLECTRTHIPMRECWSRSDSVAGVSFYLDCLKFSSCCLPKTLRLDCSLYERDGHKTAEATTEAGCLGHFASPAIDEQLTVCASN